ncbi:MAG: hypothetical protein ACOC44_19085 [Promethearchaeia archaeon]
MQFWECEKVYEKIVAEEYWDYGFELVNSETCSFDRELEPKWEYLGKKCNVCGALFFIYPRLRRCLECGAYSLDARNRYRKLPQFERILVSRDLVYWLSRILGLVFITTARRKSCTSSTTTNLIPKKSILKSRDPLAIRDTSGSRRTGSAVPSN